MPWLKSVCLVFRVLQLSSLFDGKLFQFNSFFLLYLILKHAFNYIFILLNLFFFYFWLLLIKHSGRIWKLYSKTSILILLFFWFLYFFKSLEIFFLTENGLKTFWHILLRYFSDQRSMYPFFLTAFEASFFAILSLFIHESWLTKVNTLIFFDFCISFFMVLDHRGFMKFLLNQLLFFSFNIRDKIIIIVHFYVADIWQKTAYFGLLSFASIMTDRNSSFLFDYFVVKPFLLIRYSKGFKPST